MKKTIQTINGSREKYVPGCYVEGNPAAPYCAKRLFCGTARRGEGCTEAGGDVSFSNLPTPRVRSDEFEVK